MMLAWHSLAWQQEANSTPTPTHTRTRTRTHRTTHAHAHAHAHTARHAHAKIARTLTEMKLAWHSLAIALASSVLPQPGGP
jgi:ABC-type nickel/cobalt efflux system permease component RcnA